jgi:invasion protein IalB
MTTFRGAFRPGPGLGGVIVTIALTIVPSADDAAQARRKSSPAPEKAEVTSRGHRIATDITYGDWRKLCFKAAGADTLCRTSITGKFETGQIAIRLDLIEREGGRARLQLLLPVGMYLQAGVKLSVDKGSTYPVPYTWCLANGCVAADVAATKLVKQMETGKTLEIEIVDTNILSVTTPVPLSQFATVHRSAPERIYEQDIEE